MLGSTPHRSGQYDNERKCMIEEQREYGPQPIAELMATHNLKAHDLVAASTEQITHKMVARACKGRKLSRRVQLKLVAALNIAAKENYPLQACFTY